MVNKLTLTILVSIILTVIIISTVNVGMGLFMERPEWEDYCEPFIEKTRIAPNSTDAEISAINEEQRKCQEEYQETLKPYNQARYYIFAGLGFILLLGGLFIAENLIQITGLATGGILVTQGIVVNLENKAVVFISLIAILIIFGILAYRVIKRKD